MLMVINCKGKLLDLGSPVVMGILNVTPDSFFDGGKYVKEDEVLARVEKMLLEGASIIDVGGASSRPGAEEVSAQEEVDRVVPVVASIHRAFPDAIISVDSWRAAVVESAVAGGASMVNDISGGRLDPELGPLLSRLNCPYILMHMQGKPNTMQANPQYENVVQEVLDFFIEKIAWLRSLGIKDVILDPGFGFGKTVEHNYDLLNNLHVFKAVLQLPVLAGISRKSMICKPLKVNPSAALNGTTALHMVALQQGASILRVHDVNEAVEVVELWKLLGS
ncbi:MAG: dihydropteroate synthase [Saprospiraceae bacterium]|nr:dihydropteroate synthase [Saprospiraceae bacterium]